MNDRREYMRQYRAAKKLHAVPEQTEHVPEQFEQHEHVREPARTDEHLDTQGLRAPVTRAHEPARTVRVQFPNSSRAVTNTAETVFKHPLSKYLATGALVTFVATNTAFLVAEQISFYEMKGYDFAYSTFIACLTEVAAVFLAFFGTWYRRPLVASLLIPTLAMIFSVIFMGLERKEVGEDLNSRNAVLLQDGIAIIKSQIAATEKQIEEGKNMQGALTKLQNRLLEKQDELRLVPQTHGTPKELWVMAALRVLAILWNLAFSSLIAFIWNGGSNKKIKLFPTGE